MKKIFIYTTILLSNLIFSQAPRGFYLTGGTNQTTIISDDLTVTPATGFNGGLNFQFGYHESYNFEVDIMANFKNFNVKAVEGEFNEVKDVKFKSQSIDVGFYFNYYVLRPDQDKLFLGPQIGLNMSVAGEFVTADEEMNNNRYLPYLLNDNSFMNMPQVNFDSGFGLTGGYNRFRFDLRYMYGLNNRLKGVETLSYNENNNYTGPNLKGKMSTVSLSISYLIFKTKKKRK